MKSLTDKSLTEIQTEILELRNAVSSQVAQ